MSERAEDLVAKWIDGTTAVFCGLIGFPVEEMAQRCEDEYRQMRSDVDRQFLSEHPGAPEQPSDPARADPK